MSTQWSEPILTRFRVPREELTASEGRFTNFLGVQTRVELLSHTAECSGQIFGDLPIPDDKVLGGAAEYAALLGAVDEGDGDTFTAVELGAAWGPWISAAGLACKRRGYRTINLVGVEASAAKVDAMREHLAHNGLMDLNVKLMHGAAWGVDTVLHFPKEMPITDHGGAASSESAEIDYRGLHYATEPVPAYSLETICAGLDRIDFMHWDIQGAELDVASMSRDCLDRKVKQVFIGTHSRRVEGALMEVFWRMGWDLLWEQPCGFRFTRDRPSLEGMTHTDGEQVWRNPRF